MYSTLLLLSAAAPPTDLEFQGTTVPYPSGFASWAVDAADIDGDGDVDVATGMVTTGSMTNMRVALWTNDGTGSFTSSSFIAIGARTYALRFGDLDGDGDQDLVVGLFTPGNRVLFFENDGNGAFNQSGEIFVNSIVTGLDLADLDSDGDLDVAVTLRSVVDHHVGVLLGDGLGNFPSPLVRYAVGGSPNAVDAVDLDGDGALDLVAVNRNANSISILRGLGGGTFAPEVRHSVGEDPVDLEAGDLDGDGAPDLVVSNDLSPFVTVLFGDGAGGIDRREDVPHTLRGAGVALGDADGDGDLDIALGMRFIDHVSVFENHGVGNFTPSPNAMAGYEPANVVFADLNGDGLDDLASSDDGLSGASMTALLNVSTPALGLRICDGASAACPCNNDVPLRGCRNSAGRGAQLAAEGTLSVIADDVVLTTAGMPVNGFATTVMGQPGSPTPLHNGALCLSGSLFRFAPYPTGSGTASINGLVAASQSNPAAGRIAAGSSWSFQTWYRDLAGPCGGFANLSNGLVLTFAP